MWLEADFEMKEKIKRIMEKNINSAIIWIMSAFAIVTVIIALIPSGEDGIGGIHIAAILSVVEIVIAVCLYIGNRISVSKRTLEVMYLKGKIIGAEIRENGVDANGIPNALDRYFIMQDEQNNRYKGYQLLANENVEGKQGIMFKCRKANSYYYYAVVEEDFYRT